ncbi:hypothetical protein E4U41_001957 [Claviceps citrina]|nr:hypothetical protein E4U41_001957 [Claviceps citrina]
MESMDIVPMTAPPSAPASINNDQDIQASTQHVLASLADGAADFPAAGYDGILIACFSVHTLVPALSVCWSYGPGGSVPPVPVTGIFEASILTALSFLGPGEQWGIVTTGPFWEGHLREGVGEFLGIGEGMRGGGAASEAAAGHLPKFAGVFSCGLTAGDLHAAGSSPGEVEQKLGLAARRLLTSSDNVMCVVMGCGGMAGMEDTIRRAAVEVRGEIRAKSLYVIDGVKAGILQLHQTIHAERAFR